MSQIQIETLLTAPILILTQVGRKVAQVLESLGRSAETIQEGEVGNPTEDFSLPIFLPFTQISHNPHVSR